MSRNVAAEFLLALSEPYLYPVVFLEMYFATGPLRLCTWNQDLFLNGNVYSAAKNLLQFSTIEDGSEINARGVSITLSDFDSSLLSLVLDDFQVGLPVTIYLGAFNTQTQSQASYSIVAWQGKTDQPTISADVPTSSITISCESLLMDMNTPVPYRYTNTDQQLFFPGDLGLSFVNSIQSIPVYWNQTPNSDGNP